MKTGNSVNVRVMGVYGWKESRNVIYLDREIIFKTFPNPNHSFLKDLNVLNFIVTKKTKNKGGTSSTFCDLKNESNNFFFRFQNRGINKRNGVGGRKLYQCPCRVIATEFSVYSFHDMHEIMQWKICGLSRSLSFSLCL